MSESSKTCRNYVSSAKICSASYFEDTSLAESPGKRGRRLRKELRRYSKYSKGIDGCKVRREVYMVWNLCMISKNLQGGLYWGHIGGGGGDAGVSTIQVMNNQGCWVKLSRCRGWGYK